jgi:hypothetical protein
MHIENEAANPAVVHWECDGSAASHAGSYSGIFLWNLMLVTPCYMLETLILL